MSGAAAPRNSAVTKFDYSAPTELFCRSSGGRRVSLYRRFDTAAAAIGYAVEALSTLDLQLTTLEIDELRLQQREIRELYDSGDYPRPRKRAALRGVT